MPRDLKLFVVDTGPLITLAAARSLDYLLLSTPTSSFLTRCCMKRLATRTGSARRTSSTGLRRIAPISRSRRPRAYEIFDAARVEIPDLREPDLGERAAVEVIEEPDRLLGDERGVLLCEETAVLKRVVVRDRERIVELSTLDFLRILEAEQRIQSADQVFELAAKAGRSPSRAEKMSGHDETTRGPYRRKKMPIGA